MATVRRTDLGHLHLTLFPTSTTEGAIQIRNHVPRAKKVVSDSLKLVDFVSGLMNSVLNLPDGQVKFFEEFKLQKNCEINLLIKMFLGLVEMTFGLVYASFSLPKWQALKMTFFEP